MKKFKGIFTALLTPFDKNNKINQKELERLIKFNIDMGVTGFYVCGSTSEAFLLTTRERKEIMDIVKSTAPGYTLIAHIGSINEQEAIELAHHANKLSYDLVSSVAPFYYKFSFKEIKNYYLHLAEASQLPLLIYHFPTFSGVNMGVNEISEFFADERFAGIKYTSNDFFTMEQLKTNYPEKIVYNGFDEMFISGLSMGADGAIGSTYNFMADKFVRILDLFNKNRINEARQLQQEANKIISVLCKIGVMQAEKEVLNQLGFDFGNCRPPFGIPSDEEKQLIAKEIIPLLK